MASPDRDVSAAGEPELRCSEQGEKENPKSISSSDPGFAGNSDEMKTTGGSSQGADNEKQHSCEEHCGEDCDKESQDPECEQDWPDSDELRLDLLPAEILLHICSFLHAKVVIRTLSRVCKSFHGLMTENTFWKIRIRKRWPKKYPAIPVNDGTFNWTEACIEREEQHRLWSQTATNMDYYRFTEGMFAPVDAVHLMKEGQLLAAGSRDRYLNLVDLSKVKYGEPDTITRAKVFTKMEAHKGWIWSLDSQDSILATGSWDTYVKFWDLADNGIELRKVKCKSAVLCMHYEPEMLIAGGYDARIYHIDPRSASIVNEMRYQKKPVLCLAGDDKYIVTGSEDKTIAIYDRRAGAVYKTLELESFPMSLSYGMDQLWVGDKNGGVHLVDATDGDFNLVETYDVGHTGKVTGIVHTLGAMFTSSTDKTVKVLHPTVAPDVITTLATQKAEVAGIAFQNDVLVSANSDVSVGVWMPHTADS